MANNYEGILELDDNNDYVIGGENISVVLKDMYMKEIPASYRLIVGGKVRFEEDGILTKFKNVGIIYDYCVSGNNLEERLFKLVGNVVQLEIKIGKVKDK